MALSLYNINGAVINLYPINGIVFGNPIFGLNIEVEDCKTLVVQIVVSFDPVAALNRNNWTLTNGAFVTSVNQISGDFYLIRTTRLLQELSYVLTATI